MLKKSALTACRRSRHSQIYHIMTTAHRTMSPVINSALLVALLCFVLCDKDKASRKVSEGLYVVVKVSSILSSRGTDGRHDETILART